MQYYYVMTNATISLLPPPKSIIAGNVQVTYYEDGTNSESPIVLLHGWPQTSYIWRKVFPALAEKHRVIAIDLPGMGNDNFADKTDTQSIAALIKDVCDQLQLKKFHLAGHDIGAWVAAALAIQFEDSLLSLIVMDAGIPGLIPDEVFAPANAGKIWQFYFHSISELPEMLIEGKEKEYITWYFTNKSAVKDAFTAEDIDHYYKAYTGKKRLAGGFAYYKSFQENVVQNNARTKHLDLPILAIGGEKAQGMNMGKAMNKMCVDNVTAVSIPDCGHYIPEEQPEELMRVMNAFLANVNK
ncbi:alpha/beta fold hydrolase [Chitinophaga rhizophila]|uniref:Alpha/beta hydrolase n=1 Tax=Chitinophaga rhizophila TaxID=2866212 RepID=A0ABS7GMV6_9BACT|nr:alpha/beta hydrolase [Chitinophaga rhizophila]MBW8688247.1 alpha/beta hydrolase [Chitinophaga rhizophila]